MILFFGIGLIVLVVALVVLMVDMRSPTRCVHVGRIEDHTIDGTTLIRKMSAICTVSEIRGEQVVGTLRDPPPKNALSVGDVCYGTAGFNV